MANSEDVTAVTRLESLCRKTIESRKHTLDREGRYIVEVDAVDDEGNSNSKTHNVHLDAHDIAAITTLLQAREIQVSLDVNKNNQFNIREYYDSRRDSFGDNSEEADIQHFYAKARDLSWYLDEERQQAKIEMRATGNNNLNKISLKNGKSIKTYPLSELYFLECLVCGNLTLLEYMIKNKKTMQVAGDKRFEKLLAAYQRYDRAIARAKDEQHARDYVAACICFQKTEHANRFVLAARLAEYMISHGMDAETLFSPRSTAILGRYTKARIITRTGQQFFAVDTLYNTIYTENDLQFAFERTPVERADAEDKALAFREIQFAAALHMEHTDDDKNIIINQPWTDDDFEAAKMFYKEKYPILESYRPVCSGTQEDCLLKMKYVVEIFKQLENPIGMNMQPLGPYIPLQGLRADWKKRKNK